MSQEPAPGALSCYLPQEVKKGPLWSHPFSAPQTATRKATMADNLAVKTELARKVLVSRLGRDGRRLRGVKHLARGTPIEVLRQRLDTWVEVRMIAEPTQIFLVPADAIEPATARAMSIHRPPRHRR